MARSRHPISWPFDNLRNEVDAITRYSVIYFRFLWVTSMVVRAAQGRESESSRLCVDQCCKDIPRIFTVQYGSELTSEWRSRGEMNETKKPALMSRPISRQLEYNFDFSPHSPFLRENNPGYTRVQYRRQEPLWTCPLYLYRHYQDKFWSNRPAGLHRAVDPFSRWWRCSELWIAEGSCLSR